MKPQASLTLRLKPDRRLIVEAMSTAKHAATSSACACRFLGLSCGTLLCKHPVFVCQASICGKTSFGRSVTFYLLF